MTSFPTFIRPLEIEAILHLAEARAKQLAAESSEPPRSLGDFQEGDPGDLDLAVLTLSKDALVELTALMWLGRAAGGEEVEDWPDLMKQAQDHHVGGEGDHSYVSSKAPLHEYIEAGLAKLRYEEHRIHL